MKTCRSCRWWKEYDNDDENSSIGVRNVTVGNHPVTYDVLSESQAAQLHGYLVRQCVNPKLLFYERPSRNALAILDGSQYFAALVTGEDFGCVSHDEQSGG
jgi:hypothetical protein